MPEGRLRRTREAYDEPDLWDLESVEAGAFLVPQEFSIPWEDYVTRPRFDTDRDPGDETENLWGV